MKREVKGLHISQPTERLVYSGPLAKTSCDSSKDEIAQNSYSSNHMRYGLKVWALGTTGDCSIKFLGYVFMTALISRHDRGRNSQFKQVFSALTING